MKRRLVAKAQNGKAACGNNEAIRENAKKSAAKINVNQTGNGGESNVATAMKWQRLFNEKRNNGKYCETRQQRCHRKYQQHNGSRSAAASGGGMWRP